MKILFKNTTQYTPETYAKFLEFHSVKYNFSYKLGWIYFICFIIFIVLYQIKYNKNFKSFIIIIAVLAIFFAIKFIYPKLKIKKEFKSSKISNSENFIFRFYDKYFKIHSNGKYSIIYYHSIYRVYDTDDFFYLYLNKDKSFLIDKTGFSIGTAEEFSQFLKNKYKKKYEKIQSI